MTPDPALTINKSIRLLANKIVVSVCFPIRRTHLTIYAIIVGRTQTFEAVENIRLRNACSAVFARIGLAAADLS